MSGNGEYSALTKELAKLWPNRSHESNWVKGLLCKLGLHRWHLLDVPGPGGSIKSTFCRWCTRVKLVV